MTEKRRVWIVNQNCDSGCLVGLHRFSTTNLLLEKTEYDAVCIQNYSEVAYFFQGLPTSLCYALSQIKHYCF